MWPRRAILKSLMKNLLLNRVGQILIPNLARSNPILFQSFKSNPYFLGYPGNFLNFQTKVEYLSSLRPHSFCAQKCKFLKMGFVRKRGCFWEKTFVDSASFQYSLLNTFVVLSLLLGHMILTFLLPGNLFRIRNTSWFNSNIIGNQRILAIGIESELRYDLGEVRNLLHGRLTILVFYWNEMI